MAVSSSRASEISVFANGNERSLPRGATIMDLLGAMDIDPEQSGIAVAADEAVIPRDSWSHTTLEDGMSVEVITATQGG